MYIHTCMCFYWRRECRKFNSTRHTGIYMYMHMKHVVAQGSPQDMKNGVVLIGKIACGFITFIIPHQRKGNILKHSGTAPHYHALGRTMLIAKTQKLPDKMV